MIDKRDFESQINKINKRIWLFNVLAWISVISGLIIFAVGLRFLFDDGDTFNEVGDFIGGVGGSLWALAGLFFIYIAFLGQKIDIKYQQEDLTLTRAELNETKEVFKQQTQIMSNQQLDNTFFNLLDNHRKFVDSFKKGEKNYSKYGYIDSNLEIVSGYNVLEKIFLEIEPYFKSYSDYLNTKNIFDYKLTQTNPLELLLSYTEVQLLYSEVYNILSFIENKVKGEERLFYFKTLSNNLTVEEKFLIEAFDENHVLNSSGLISFNVYDKYNFSKFRCVSFIEKRLIKLNGEFGYRYLENYQKNVDFQNDIRLIVDEIDYYSSIDIYFINSEEKKLHHVIKFDVIEREINLSKTFMKIAKTFFEKQYYIGLLKRGRNASKFKILVRSIDVFNDVNIFYVHEIEVKSWSNSDYYFSPSYSNNYIQDWMRDYFIRMS